MNNTESMQAGVNPETQGPGDSLLNEKYEKIKDSDKTKRFEEQGGLDPENREKMTAARDEIEASQKTWEMEKKNARGIESSQDMNR